MAEVPEPSRVLEAALDYRYLLSRGYAPKSSLDLVVSRYGMRREARLLLLRCVHSPQYVKEALTKLRCKAKEGEPLLLDFYNTLLTVLCMLQGCSVYLCDDCVVRDLRGSGLRASERALLPKAYQLMVKAIMGTGFRRVEVVADKEVSHSLRDARAFVDALKELAGDAGLDVSLTLSQTPDAYIIESSRRLGACAASSDALVIEGCACTVPLANIVASMIQVKPALSFPEILGYTCEACLE